MKVGDLVKHCQLGLGIVLKQRKANSDRWYVYWAKFPIIHHAISEWKLEVINESR